MVQEGDCVVKICKRAQNICQIRLDFDTFVITGPSTSSTSIGKHIGGNTGVTSGIEIAQASVCSTDTFSVTGQTSIPTICGTNTGYHGKTLENFEYETLIYKCVLAYFDASDDCNLLSFQLGNNPIGVTSVATRSWSIKVTQYDCNYENLAPSGCTQYHFGPTGTGYVQSFNWAGSDYHLADQRQVICVRRERSYDTICYSADSISDFDVSGTVTNGIYVDINKCSDYGATGLVAGALMGYDHLFISRAEDSAGAVKAGLQCGRNNGLGTTESTTAGTGTTVCCKFCYRFNISVSVVL